MALGRCLGRHQQVQTASPLVTLPAAAHSSVPASREPVQARSALDTGCCEPLWTLQFFCCSTGSTQPFRCHVLVSWTLPVLDNERTLQKTDAAYNHLQNLARLGTLTAHFMQLSDGPAFVFGLCIHLICQLLR